MPSIMMGPPTPTTATTIRQRHVLEEIGCQTLTPAAQQSVLVSGDMAGAVHALNVLQEGKDSPMQEICLNIAVGFHLYYLHPKVNALVGYLGPQAHLEPLFEMEQNAVHFSTTIEPRIRQFRVASTKWFEEFKSKSYIIWPIIIRKHLFLIILHLRRRDRWSDIDHILVADPVERAEHRQFVFERIALIFTQDNGFRIRATEPVNFWHPVQGSDLSCGFRVYDMIRTFLWRINEACIRSWEADTQMMDVVENIGEDSALDLMVVDDDSERSYGSDQPNYPDPRDGYVGTLWDDLSGDFQWGKVRAEMIGIVATECMRLGNYATRIFLGPVDQIRMSIPIDGRGPDLQYGQDGFRLSNVQGDLEPIQKPPMGRSELKWQELRRQQIVAELVAAGPLGPR